MISNRVSKTLPSYTIEISSKVNKLIKNGVNVIDLSIGEPNFNVPEKAKSIGIDSINNNKTKYNLINGLDILREEVKEKLLYENGCNYDLDEIVISSGAKNCITNALMVLTNVDDEVLLPSPYWVSYSEIIKILSAKPIVVPTQKSNNFKVSCDDLEKYISNKTKVLILNNPCNPTGSVYSRDELIEIVEFCDKNNIYIISDEIYERVCFNDSFTSVASLSDKAKDITITINGFSKSSAMTGLRLGYTASNKSFATAIKTVQGHLISHPSLTAQYIGYGALKYCKSDIDNMVNIYKSRRDIMCSKLDDIKNISYIYPEGAFYIFLDISNLKSKFNYDESFSLCFCKQFLDDYNVAIVPGIAFGMDDFVRLSFACSDDDIINGVEKLKLFIEHI